MWHLSRMKFRQFFVIVFATTVINSTSSCTSENSSNEEDSAIVHLLQEQAKQLYLVEYEMTAENLIMTKPKASDVLLQQGGQFSAYIDKKNFPIKAPNCAKLIIVGMKETKKSAPNAEQSIADKIDLHYDLQDVYKKKTASKKVIIELNPYIIKATGDLDKIELARCNVYFRTYRGKYINSLKALKI